MRPNTIAIYNKNLPCNICSKRTDQSVPCVYTDAPQTELELKKKSGGEVFFTQEDDQFILQQRNIGRHGVPYKEIAKSLPKKHELKNATMVQRRFKELSQQDRPQVRGAQGDPKIQHTQHQRVSQVSAQLGSGGHEIAHPGSRNLHNAGSQSKQPEQPIPGQEAVDPDSIMPEECTAEIDKERFREWFAYWTERRKKQYISAAPLDHARAAVAKKPYAPPPSLPRRSSQGESSTSAPQSSHQSARQQDQQESDGEDPNEDLYNGSPRAGGPVTSQTRPTEQSSETEEESRILDKMLLNFPKCAYCFSNFHKCDNKRPRCSTCKTRRPEAEICHPVDRDLLFRKLKDARKVYENAGFILDILTTKQSKFFARFKE